MSQSAFSRGPPAEDWRIETIVFMDLDNFLRWVGESSPHEEKSKGLPFSPELYIPGISGTTNKTPDKWEDYPQGSR